MQPTIRDVVSVDRDAIFAINRDSLSGVSELTCQYFACLLKECSFFRVLEVEEELAGYVCALNRHADYDGEEFHWFREHVGGELLYIDQVAIARHWRGRGLGRTLYNELDTYANLNEFTVLTCEVNYEPMNVESWAFHRRFGFLEVDRMKTRGLTVSLMAKHRFARVPAPNTC